MIKRSIKYRYILISLIILIFLFNVFPIYSVESLLKYNSPSVGDLDKMLVKNTIRVLVPYSKTFYFLDGAEQKGLTYEQLKEFEKFINKKYKRRNIRIRVVVIPTRRDQLINALLNGIGDIAAGNLTITPKRKEKVNFSTPLLSDVSEIIVTGPSQPKIKSLESLNLHIRKSSSYYESITKLNRKLARLKKSPIHLTIADELLEDEDILEMINAGMIPMTVIDSHKARFWNKIFTELNFYYDLKVKKNGKIAWAFRKNSPQLKKLVDEFVTTHKKGTLIGNILFTKYLKSTKWISNLNNSNNIKRFNSTSGFFKKYSNLYGFDWLIIIALAFQESRIDQTQVSEAGAVGVMQILPSTAQDSKVNIPNIRKIEPNIHAGTKYLRYLRDNFFNNSDIDSRNKIFFTLASYNAGPGKIRKLRHEAAEAGLDENRWFQNVEIIASKRIGRETVRYVSNIYKYYIVYSILENDQNKKSNVVNKNQDELL